ncbi:MAG: ABC transporter permease [Clostridia bacterium]|nr:ABC transporter permease [Clostridia bacterium]
MRNKKISPYYIVGGILFSIIVIACISGLLGVGPDPEKTSASSKLLAPSASHIMGTDNMGRDLFARVLAASKYTLFISFAGVSVALVLGTIAGMLAGYFGGIWDRIIMLLGNSIMCFPGILLALVAVSVSGPSLFNVIWALGLVFAPTFARVYRTEVIKIKGRDYILHAKILGVNPIRIMAVHIFPNAFAQIIPAIVIGLANMTLSESAMSYLGLGVQPPKASYGKILSDAQSYITAAPWLVIFPSLMLVIYILGLYFISEGIRGDK